MPKVRGFSIVLHDVQKGSQTKVDVETKVKTLQWRQYVIAEEPYNHQEGSHIHLFLQLKNQVSFTSMLSTWCKFWKSGRVQVDQMRGAMAQATDYVNPDRGQKDKYFDPDPLIFLDSVDAQAAEVEAKVVTRQDLMCHWCDECFHSIFKCPNWEKLLKQYAICNPPKPQMCIHKSEYLKCSHPDCIKYREADAQRRRVKSAEGA